MGSSSSATAGDQSSSTSRQQSSSKPSPAGDKHHIPTTASSSSSSHAGVRAASAPASVTHAGRWQGSCDQQARDAGAPQAAGGTQSGCGVGDSTSHGDGNKALELENMPPHWNETLRCWCLNFKGRVKLASVKNFQLVQAGLSPLARYRTSRGQGGAPIVMQVSTF